MARETQPYKRSFSASVGTGLGSLFGAGKQYYILEHKINSKYHKVGESQEIIVDNIELGRDPKCQVRFDDTFSTVSRRHAAIVKDGDKWKLIQLSKTNPTFLNRAKVGKEWYLQNGDEIQLAIGGPRLGFIIPSGNKSTTGTIGLSRRLSLFRQQALRPYKQAITALGVMLLLTVGGMSAWKIHGDKENDARFKNLVAQYNREIENLANNNAGMRAELDSLANLPPPPPSTVTVRQPAVEIEDLIEKCKDDVYYLDVPEVYITDGRQKEIVYSEGDTLYGWGGTGFLLDDGRFVTARHCVHGWRWDTKYENVINKAAMAESRDGLAIIATIIAKSRTGKQLEFKSTDFICDDRYDGKKQWGVAPDGVPIFSTHALWKSNDQRVWSTDWTYVKTSSRGVLSADPQLSDNLRTGTDLHVLGFPGFTGVGETLEGIAPAYNRFSVGFDGLNVTGCFLHTRGTDHGNSGGPIFARKDGKLVVVGIVSRGSNKSDEYNYGVPISAIK